VRLRLRSWLLLILLVLMVVKHRPLIALGIAILLAASGLAHRRARRKPARHV